MKEINLHGIIMKGLKPLKGKYLMFEGVYNEKKWSDFWLIEDIILYGSPNKEVCFKYRRWEQQAWNDNKWNWGRLNRIQVKSLYWSSPTKHTIINKKEFEKAIVYCAITNDK